MMLLAALALMAIGTECFLQKEARVRQGVATQQPCLENRTFTENLLFESAAHSKSKCALKCLGQERCEAFTLITPSATCRGHSSVPTSASTSSPSPGTTTWTFPDLGIPCPLNCDYQLVAPGTCLRLYLTGKTHADARTRCQQDDATLYRMKTEERRQLLEDFVISQGEYNITFIPCALSTASHRDNADFRKHTLSPFTLSFYLSSKKGIRMWLDGTKSVDAWMWGDGDTLPVNSSLWYPGEPSGPGNCIQSYVNYRLDDIWCHSLRPYLCELFIP
ncbi:hypothetical protein BaRGS_00018770 [Batillaria attramentaria]|uniref:C-type lectin domain-containing protein n=1 Tax=Batillaria attramentaria TaxID=370345 RepID=A0ABD0KSF1_9CAEN